MGVLPNSGYLETVLVTQFLKHFRLCAGQSNKGINLWPRHQHFLHHVQTNLVGKDKSGSKDLL